MICCIRLRAANRRAGPKAPAGPVAQEARARDQRGEARAAASAASFDVLLTRAQEQVPGWVMIMLRLQPRGDGPVTASIQGPDAFHPFQRSQLTLNRATGDVVKWEPYANNSTGRKLRTWVRALHTGEAFGFIGQTVAGFASLGGCFLVWTGLAMAWRRFRSWRRTPKEFTAEESVMNANIDQIKFPNPHQPETESVDAGLAHPLSETQTSRTQRCQRPRSSGAGSRARASDSAVQRRVGVDSLRHRHRQLRGARQEIGQRIAARPVSLRMCSDMAHCQPNVLKQANCVLVVASTYGDGEPPDDAAPFWEAIVHGNGLDLSGVKYSVLALGNTTYDHFCKCGRELDAALERHGAMRIYPRVDCDVDYDDPAGRWIEGVLANLRQEQNSFRIGVKGELRWCN